MGNARIGRVVAVLLLFGVFATACSDSKDKSASSTVTREPLNFGTTVNRQRPAFGTTSGRVCAVVPLSDASKMLQLGFPDGGVAVPITDDRVEQAAKKGIDHIDSCTYRISASACPTCGSAYISQQSLDDEQWTDTVVELSGSKTFQKISNLGDDAYFGSTTGPDGKATAYLVVRAKPWLFGIGTFGVAPGSVEAIRAGSIELVNRFL